MKLTSTAIKNLKLKLDDNERIGFITSKGNTLKVVETLNISPEPNDNFIFDPQDLQTYVFSGEHKAVATWHTHPTGGANLSVNDYVGFLNYPQLKHIIVAQDEIRIYEVEDGAIFQVTQN